jgi:beta-galactosidase
MERFPFLFGAQYYRAPTPEPECWAGDFAHMRELGFNAVKFFVQWRWSHRAPEHFFFDDLDALMELAGAHGLGVTLNFILDMAPVWLYDRCPDARQIDVMGHVVEPYAVSHRSAGGHPGPCYNHPEALLLRRSFVEEAIYRYRAHPALQMWDVWNEPELSFQQRTPSMANMVCYCDNCHRGFIGWLQRKYASLDHLNAVWGRPYAVWSQVEMPRVTGSIQDFIDWREFHLDTMTGEARWRLELVASLDSAHGRYLHVVPVWFSAVTCVDDFAVAEPCEVFAATMNASPAATTQVVSAARGKRCYNVESHVNHGFTDIHQSIIDAAALRRDLLPQVGLGIKGFLFWQYRPEVLGCEAPAWGLVRPDGTDRPVTRAARDFWGAIRPYADALLEAMPATPQVAIWKSRKNEIFHFCTQGTIQTLNTAIDAYTQALYWQSVPFSYINASMLVDGALDGIRVLVMPSCYYLTQPEIDALDRWVRAGGVLLNEAHLAGYNGTTGRHSRVLPGGGLAEGWGIREVESTSSFHLKLDEQQVLAGAMPEDVRKALAQYGTAGGTHYPIRLAGGGLAWGAHRYAELAGERIVAEGAFNVAPCLASLRVGNGAVLYCGTNFGQAEPGRAGLRIMLDQALRMAGVRATADCLTSADSVHLDILHRDGQPAFAVVLNRTAEEQTITVQTSGLWRSLFTGAQWRMTSGDAVLVPAAMAELFEIA